MEDSLEANKAALDRFLADNPELEELSARLATFNLFRVLKIEKAEIRHSNVLAWLLDPAESHGLDDIVLRRLLSNILLEGEGEIEGISAADIELMEFRDIEVRREWRQIDVLVIDRHNRLLLLMENKVYGGESNRQLFRYREIVKKEFPPFRLIPVFLTLPGEASEDEEATDYLSYSYEQALVVLERVFQQRRSQLPEAVAVFLCHYLDTLRRLTMRDETLKELCKTIYQRHREAINLIKEYGEVSILGEVGQQALPEDSGYEILNISGNMLWFLPPSWKNIVPENSLVWKRLNRPVSIACWIKLRSETVKLTFEICRMDDPELRLACVRALEKTGFKFTAKAFRPEAKYSRFYQTSETLSDPDEKEELAAAIDKLLQKAKPQFSKAEEAFKNVFQKS